MMKKYNNLKWDEWYSLAEEYQVEYGNLAVERNYVTVGGYKLGRWIERQRAKYNGTIANGISPECISRLENIGMIWKLETRTKFDVWLGLCREYKAEYGDLLIPKLTVYRGYALGEWIIEQREKYSCGKLSESEISELDGLGMVWSVIEHHPWNEWYDEAAEYYSEYGNLLVPRDYVTSSGKKLGAWIFSQREKRRYRATYPKYRVEMLGKIGMVWSPCKLRSKQ